MRGSRTYLDWIDALFTEDGQAPIWQGTDYDLAVADSPAELEDWVATHHHAGRSARMIAGFCWPWDSPPTPPLTPEVSIPWTDETGDHLWQRPWNSGAGGILAGTDIPGRAFWATDQGGHQQIACVYTPGHGIRLQCRHPRRRHHLDSQRLAGQTPREP
ncbi:hypothetical protein GCM10022233_65530 [Streptomyces shaanxiensis]|uniref:Schlafen group 3-like DNA/RNA helicase domain-containing protein n=1 Tax=Streptomyces shaanxiensis TaxID=653357 RepID=A0ABP7VYP2_9ACTN